MAKEALSPGLAMPSQKQSIKDLQARVLSPKTVVDLPDLDEDDTSTRASTAGSTERAPSDMSSAYARRVAQRKHAIWRRVIHLVYAQQDVATLKTLCRVSRRLCQIAEDLLYRHLQVVSVENLGMLACIGMRQRGLIRSLTILDETPTRHSDPSVIWTFISTLPNLETLDIQHALILWRPPDNLYLPQLRNLRFRLVGSVSELTLAERLHLDRSSGGVRSLVKQKDLHIDVHEDDEWVDKLADQAPQLSSLAIIFAGPLERVTKRIGDGSGKKLVHLKLLEFRIAEHFFDIIPDLIKGIVGRAMQLENLLVHGYPGCMNWISTNTTPRLVGIVPNLDLPSLKVFAVVLHRHHCPKCPAYLDRTRSPAPECFFDELHAWFNAYWRSMPTFCTYELKVILHTETERGYGGGHGGSWEEVPMRRENECFVWFYSETDYNGRESHDQPKHSRIYTWRDMRHYKPVAGPLLNILANEEVYTGWTEATPRPHESEAHHVERPLPDPALHLMEVAEDNDLQSTLKANGFAAIREHYLKSRNIDGLLEKQRERAVGAMVGRHKDLMGRMHNHAIHHEDIVQRCTSSDLAKIAEMKKHKDSDKEVASSLDGGKGQPRVITVNHHGKAYTRAEVDRAKQKTPIAMDTSKVENNVQAVSDFVAVNIGPERSYIPRHKFNEIMTNGNLTTIYKQQQAHPGSRDEHEASGSKSHSAEDDHRDHAADCHCDACRKPHANTCKCGECLACKCHGKACCHSHGFTSRNHCKHCGIHITDIPGARDVQEELFRSRSPAGGRDKAAEVTPPAASPDDSDEEAQQRKKPRPKRG